MRKNSLSKDTELKRKKEIKLTNMSLESLERQIVFLLKFVFIIFFNKINITKFSDCAKVFKRLNLKT